MSGGHDKLFLFIMMPPPSPEWAVAVRIADETAHAEWQERPISRDCCDLAGEPLR